MSETVPQAPRNLPNYGRDLWEQLAPILYETGLLTEADLAAFELCCMAYARALEARDVVKKEGLFSLGAAGQTVRHPATDLETKYIGLFRQYASQFGLLPASRGGIDIPPPADADDPLAEFLGNQTPARMGNPHAYGCDPAFHQCGLSRRCCPSLSSHTPILRHTSILGWSPIDSVRFGGQSPTPETTSSRR